VAQIDWDPAKAHANLRAHGLGFPEAVTVLDAVRQVLKEEMAAAKTTQGMPASSVRPHAKAIRGG
jgi:uncharacterized DUF497 family protein